MSLKLNHKPKKYFGQNFLQDPFTIEKIIHTLHLATDDRVIEIGPGLGALTTPLLTKLNHLEVIEIDRDLASSLKKTLGDSEIIIHNQDVLNFNFSNLVTLDNSSKKLRIIGNLPYNISTPLIFHLLTYAHLIEDMYFMLQKEVADRLTATPHQKSYGRLSLMVQYYCKVNTLFNVNPKAFYPVPKVQSAFVCLKPYLSPPILSNNFSVLQEITRTAFNQRRKTIANALKTYLSISDFSHLNLDPKLRPEALSLSDFVQISNFIHARSTSVS